MSRRAAAQCQPACATEEWPCASCSSGRQFGDANGDCCFDANDVTFVRTLLNTIQGDVSHPAFVGLEPFQQRAVDADRNTNVNTDTAAFIATARSGEHSNVSG